MTLRGYWDALERPFIEAEIALPGRGAVLGVPLMVDTGASFTAINPGDLGRGWLPQLGPPEAVGSGYGGAVMGHVVAGLVGFRCDDGLHIYQLALRLVTDPSAAGLPSVVGRDVLRYWRTVHDPMNDLLEFELWQADRFVPR